MNKEGDLKYIDQANNSWIMEEMGSLAFACRWLFHASPLGHDSISGWQNVGTNKNEACVLCFGRAARMDSAPEKLPYVFPSLVSLECAMDDFPPPQKVGA